MNKKNNIYSLILLLPALLFFSCSDEDMPVMTEGTDEPGIMFRVSMTEPESRSSSTTVAATLYEGFRVTAFCLENNVNGTLNPYFSDQCVKPLTEKPGYYGIFDQESELCIWPSSRHGKLGKLKFFAFYPSRETLRQNSGENTEYFDLINKTTQSGSTIKYDYQIAKFKVTTDISRHIDFVTATVEGSKTDNSETGVKLAFEHQLSCIQLKAWGNTPNDIEIAGVRIGGVVTESDFNFAKKPAKYAKGDATLDGDWVGQQKKETVEYIFREGDTVVKIGNGNHTSVSAATSIMGNGGMAMVIPSNYASWDYKGDGLNTNKQGLYFSVLMRVKEGNEDRTLVYPYTAGVHLSTTVMTDDMNVVFMSIEKKSGKVMKRLYRNPENLKFYTEPDFVNEYTAPDSEEIRNYGWAAVPFTRLWKPGYQYVYTLNYSVGVGLHDPTDPLPGSPIIWKILVGITEDKQTWPMVVNNFAEGGEKDITHDIKVE